MVRSPLTFEISAASNFEFQRTIVTPSSSGRITSVGRSAIASRRNRTDRLCAGTGDTGPSVASDIPGHALAVDRLARNAEPARGFLAVAAALLQDRENVPPLDVGETAGRRNGVFCP